MLTEMRDDPATDSRVLTGSQQETAEAAYGIALKIAGKYASKFPHLREEFESVAGLAACNAAAKFDPSRGVSLKTFVACRANGACKDVMRSCGSILGTYRTSGAASRTPPPVESLDWADEDGNIRDFASGELPIGWEAESEDEVLSMSRKLPATYGEAVRRYLLHAETATMKATARAAGLSESRVSQIHSRAASMLAHAMGGGRQSHQGGGPTMSGIEDEVETEDVTTDTVQSKPNSGNGRCPKCERPYGARKRCYSCSPIYRPREVTTKPTSKPEIKPLSTVTLRGRDDGLASDPLDSAIAELDAVRVMLDALRSLPHSSRGRVVAYVSSLTSTGVEKRLEAVAC